MVTVDSSRHAGTLAFRLRFKLPGSGRVMDMLAAALGIPAAAMEEMAGDEVDRPEALAGTRPRGGSPNKVSASLVGSLVVADRVDSEELEKVAGRLTPQGRALVVARAGALPLDLACREWSHGATCASAPPCGPGISVCRNAWDWQEKGGGGGSGRGKSRTRGPRSR